MSGSFAPNLPPNQPGFITGRYYVCHFYNGPTTGSLTTGSIYYTYFYTPTTVSVDRICINVTTASASNTVRLGIYNLSGTTPTSLIVDGGDLSIATTGSKEATINVTLTPGWYALSAMQSGGSGVFSTIGSTAAIGGYVLGTTSVATSFNTCSTATLTYGALPSTASTTSLALASGAPVIWLRAS